MKFLRFFVLLGLLTPWIAVAQIRLPVAQPTIPSYLITNDDAPNEVPTSGSFFTFAANGLPQNPTRVSLGANGSGGGYFNANRASIYENGSDVCAYLSLGGSGVIGGVDLQTLDDVGNFSGGVGDSGVDNGIGLVNNGTYLYANFTTSNTIATFAIEPGCSASFLGDISPLGLQAGNVKGMALHGNMLVVTYGDGSIESFNTSGGIPVSNGDLQNATGYRTSRFPTGVDITEDGNYAIFGDQSTYATVEVSNISSGKLTTTVLYNLGQAGNQAGNSTNVLLSPDETLLYVGNTASGQVSAAFFDASTGKISTGCSSAPLNGFDVGWIFLGGLVNELNTGTGSVLYVAEFGSSSGIGAINVTSTGTTCTLTEISGSPVLDPNSVTLLSLAVYPPRQF
jgi:hypothetical protein